MKILSIDIGTYSVKVLDINLDRKTLLLDDAKEYLISDAAKSMPLDSTLEQIQTAIIEAAIPENFDGKVFFQLPNNFVTTRYMKLPVTNRKKLDLMLPFQLDENLPYPSSNAHFVASYFKNKNDTDIIVNITKESDFERFYELLQTHEILPSVLTSEMSVVNKYSQTRRSNAPYAILDVGHETTKCYIISEQKLVSNHISFTAGKSIDEVISETYEIPNNEAVTYKHNNCFFLTESQYENVSEDQKDFALLMKHATMPLILDIKRWLLGFRVKHGLTVENIYLMGGTSSINNFSNFLSQMLEIKVLHIETPESIIDRNDLIAGYESNYAMATFMARASQLKDKPVNFLQGHYSSGGGLQFPLHSTAFLLSRALILCLFLSTILIVERLIITKPNIVSVDRQINKLLKNPELGLTAKDRRTYRRRPERILKKLEQQQKNITQEVSTIMASSKVNALSSFSQLAGNITSTDGVYLTTYSNQEGTLRATFTGDSAEQMESFFTKLRTNSSYAKGKFRYKTGTKTLSFAIEETLL
tara:strand:- start:172971 stop:174563 length:1593 start_codon:yes stop_codon:yes gene_type:complete